MTTKQNKYRLGTALLVFVCLLCIRPSWAALPESPQLTGELHQATMAVDGMERSYSYYQPKVLASSPALVFVLHGSRGTGRQMRQMSAYEFDVLADRDGFIVVYPDGYKNHWNDCRASANYRANEENVNDILFLSEIVGELSASLGIDKQRVFATGISNGGHMAYKLALESPGMVAAIAPVAANMPIDENLDCKKSGEAVSVAMFNGTNDPINPYNGGMVTLMGDSSRGAVLSSDQSALYWVELAGIEVSPQTIIHAEQDDNPVTSVVEQRWTADNGLQVRLYRLQGSGHVFPSTITIFPPFFGGNAGDLSGPKEIVGFFWSTATSLPARTTEIKGR